MGMQIIQQNRVTSTPSGMVIRIFQSSASSYQPWHSPPVQLDLARFHRPDARHHGTAVRAFSLARQAVFRDNVTRSPHDHPVAVGAEGALVLAHPAGDIAGGEFGMKKVLQFGTGRPYKLGNGVYLCSSATPPGAGVHGMCGVFAAKAALEAMG